MAHGSSLDTDSRTGERLSDYAYRQSSHRLALRDCYEQKSDSFLNLTRY